MKHLILIGIAKTSVQAANKSEKKAKTKLTSEIE